MSPEVYSDQRYHEYQGPSRTVRHPRACTVGGGTFAISEDGTRCVVAGNDVLRIIRVRNPVLSRKSPSRSRGQILSSSSTDASTRICTGPGGATIEIGQNMWTASGLKIDSAPTDAVWARGKYDNKIVTSARNGEIIYWDINKSGSKYETRIKEHKRAVNKLAISPFLPYLFASGSQDGHLRLWDLRSPPSSIMKVYHPTGIRALALCPVSSNPMTVCTGLESGNIQRWDLRSRALPLERITLAHSSSILSMDWQLPSMKETGLGWLVTSGMDRQVKVWNLCVPPGSSIPANTTDREALFLNNKMGPSPSRTLHTPFPVRNVCWRPGYDCEVAVVSNNDSDTETVEIWDIRRGWIGKWALDDAEGGITDIAFVGSHKLWAQHVNGTFIQYDLRESFRPLDSIPRVAMSWTAQGGLAFVANNQPAVELPFDDVHPMQLGAFQDLNLRHKATSDPEYVPYQQTLGVQDLSLLDHPAFVRLAKSYVCDGDRMRLCEINAQRAREAGQLRAAQTWSLLHSQLLDSGVTSAPSVLSAKRPSHLESKTQITSPSASVASRRGRESCNSSAISHGISTWHTRILDKHQRETSPLLYRTQQEPPVSTPSPRLRKIHFPSLTPQHSPSLSHAAPIASTKMSQPASRRASTVLPMLPRTQRVALRRASISTPGISGGHSVNDLLQTIKHAHVGEGALDDSDSSSGSEAAASTADSAGHDVIGIQTDAPLIPRIACDLMPPDLSLEFPASMEVSPDRPLDEDAGNANEYDSDRSDASQSASSSSAESRADGHQNVLRAPDKNREKTSQSPSPGSRRYRGTSILALHRSLTKQESHNSMRTVTASPSDAASVHASSIDILLPDTPDLAPGGRTSSVINGDEMSTRRPSPQPHRAVPSPVPMLGLSNMGDTMNSQANSEVPNFTPSESRLSEERTRQVMEDEVDFREIGWKALRETLDWFAEKGDVQMCALLALVAPEELHVSSFRAARFSEAYIDMLSRLQLHILAAHLRKHVPYDAIRNTSQVQTIMYSSCGQCGSPFKMSAVGGAVLCEKCKSLPTLCAVCHLPVHKLLVHCPTCGHGGHQACYREFYLTRPLTELPTDTMKTFPRGSVDSYSSTDASSSVYYSLSDSSERGTRGDDGLDDDDDSEQDGSGGRGSDKDRVKADFHESEATTGNSSERRPNMRVLGHACAAGCGHWCWAANEQFTAP